jgi:hypothetical protein
MGIHGTGQQGSAQRPGRDRDRASAEEKEDQDPEAWMNRQVRGVRTVEPDEACLGCQVTA